ncbi:serine/arginine repetitive matrix protein 3-like [Lathamus discolor]|uniref:serine/arginine repetitive matrix protein 3-like n=1 Tax=Lathamus discolor TaxID=678569 RepID=UPI0032B804A0
MLRWRYSPRGREARQACGRSALTVAAIHQPSEPRGGRNPPAFGSPAASPRLRSAPTRLGSRGPARSGGGRRRRGKAGRRPPGAGAAPQKQPQRGNAVALSGEGACGAGAGGGCGEKLPRFGLWSEGTEAERSIFPHDHGGQRGRERSVPLSSRRGRGKALALPPVRFAPWMRSPWPGKGDDMSAERGGGHDQPLSRGVAPSPRFRSREQRQCRPPG